MKATVWAWTTRGMISFALLVMISLPAEASRCLFVSSYHPGYAWADDIEEGVREVLIGQCEFHQLNMDTKRNKSERYIKAKALEVKQFIDEWKPDVVIVADDNASKYLVKPYYKDADIPFVFCGVNWTVSEYGYPYSNVTGMIEVSPIRQIFEKIHQIVPQARRGFYIGANTLTEHKSYLRFRKVAERDNIRLEKRLALTQAEWIDAYREAQQGDFIILGTKSGINDWDDLAANQAVAKFGKKLSLTDYEWMVRFATLGLTKVAKEHGEWAAMTALEILNGVRPIDIPIIPNQRWDMYVNPDLVKRIDVKLPDYILVKSKEIHAQ